MKEEKILKSFCSIPVILVVLYFLPILGIGLILLRIYLNDDNTIKTPIILLCTSLVILLFKGLEKVSELLNIKNKYIEETITNKVYIKVMDFGKFLLILSIILVIVGCLIKLIYVKVLAYSAKKAKEAISKQINEPTLKEEEPKEIKNEKIEEKEELVERTMECPYCSATLKFKGEKGFCKYCKKMIKYEEPNTKK